MNIILFGLVVDPFDLTSQVRNEREETFFYADVHLFSVVTNRNRG